MAFKSSFGGSIPCFKALVFNRFPLVFPSMRVCTSCNKHVVSDFVEFPCPGNLKVKIVRCQACRESVKPYSCEMEDGKVYTGP
ncbi:MAG: zinc finger domain-containing protein [Candidatus Diapherotrites archaeon]